jgi:hypothetical protein
MSRFKSKNESGLVFCACIAGVAEDDVEVQVEECIGFGGFFKLKSS